MQNLYELGPQVRELSDFLDSIDGDLSRLGDGEAAFVAFMEGILTDEDAKLESLACWVRECEAQEEVFRKEAEYWAQKARWKGNRAARIKDAIRGYFETTGKKKFTTSKGRVLAVQVNGGKVAMTIRAETKPEDVPAEFTRREIDRERVREALDAGREFDWASLEPRGSHVRIR